MREYKNPLCIREAHLNCPLPLSLEAYWNCEADCLHCMGRRLNQVWGTEQRAADPERVCRTLTLAASKPARVGAAPLTAALAQRKALWIGRKADPYQPLELERHVTRHYIQTLTALNWPFIICTRYTDNAMVDEGLLTAGGMVTMLVEITPGGEADWDVFERRRTTPVENRLRAARQWMRLGIRVGVRGEPYIPGYHTPKQFRDMLRRLRAFGLRSYNTYNLHLNPYTLQRLCDAGLDIERIWAHNQDTHWRPIQQRLCRIAQEEGIELGCPDFVNVPTDWRARVNTCCGVPVAGAFTFNTHHWRQMLQCGVSGADVLARTWEGIGTEKDRARARLIVTGNSEDFYTMKDAGL